MKKALLAVLAIVLILTAAGCEDLPSGATETGAPSLSSPVPEEPTASPKSTEDSSKPPTPEPTENTADIEAAQLFKSFLSKNYDKLMDLSFKYIVGIGFIDLDLDGVRELILFDAGASASMGVEIFEVFEGEVRCVTANIAGIAEEFGGGTSQVIVNANFFEDFRLLEDSDTGESFFVVESKNGSVEFTFSELIRFGTGPRCELALESLFYKYDEYDTDTGEVSLSRFKIGGSEASKASFTAAWDSFYSRYIDAELECQGVFVWENSEYTENYKNFMENVEKALSLYESNRVS